MKKGNKKIVNKLQELMIRAYSVTKNDINDEIGALILSKTLDIYKKHGFYGLFNKLIFLKKHIFYRVFGLHQEFSTKLKQIYRVVSKITKTIKTEDGDIILKRRRYVKYDEEKMNI